MDSSSIVLHGLHQAAIQLETAALRIASAGSPDNLTVDAIELSAEIVALMSAQTVFESNLATLKTADQMQKSLLDIKI
jgi:flagellar hook protein FlgE